MSIVSDNLPVIDFAQQLLTDFGLSPWRVFIRLNAWSGGDDGLGTLTITDMEILPRPDVIEQPGDVILICGITPPYNGGGWLPGLLNPADLVGQDHTIIIVGPSGTPVPYLAVDFNGRDPMEFVITAKQLEHSKPTDGW